MSPQEHRLVALAKANTIRLAKAALRRELAALPYTEGMARLAGLIVANDEIVMAFPFGDALAACRHLGDVGVAKFAGHVGVTHAERRLRDLSDRQLTILVEALRDPARVGTYGSLGTGKPRPRRPKVVQIRRGPEPVGQAAALFAAISEHHRDVTSPSAPAEAFAQADAKLWAAASRIMGRRVVRRRRAAA